MIFSLLLVKASFKTTLLLLSNLAGSFSGIEFSVEEGFFSKSSFSFFGSFSFFVSLRMFLKISAKKALLL
jgi:hypothetical protein